jgi:hypothetical protein
MVVVHDNDYSACHCAANQPSFQVTEKSRRSHNWGAADSLQRQKMATIVSNQEVWLGGSDEIRQLPVRYIPDFAGHWVRLYKWGG